MAHKRKNPWPWGVGIGLLMVVGANAAMLTIAVRNAPVLEREQYYEASLVHQATIDARRASAALGWQATVEVAADGVRYRILDAEARPVVGLRGELRLTRADTEAADGTLPLVEAAPGEYRGALGATHRGVLRAEARLEGGAVPWLDERRLVVP